VGAAVTMRNFERDIIKKKIRKIFPDVVLGCRDNSSPTLKSISREFGISSHAVQHWYIDWMNENILNK